MSPYSKLYRFRKNFINWLREVVTPELVYALAIALAVAIATLHP